MALVEYSAYAEVYSKKGKLYYYSSKKYLQIKCNETLGIEAPQSVYVLRVGQACSIWVRQSIRCRACNFGDHERSLPRCGWLVHSLLACFPFEHQIIDDEGAILDVPVVVSSNGLEILCCSKAGSQASLFCAVDLEFFGEVC